nr:nucleotidyltransferase family protein [uncultured Draconibacterium sp.]
MTDLLQNRAYLHERHRLSHQQIDCWLGENRAKEFLSEKLKQLEAVKNFLFVTDLLTKNNISYICLKGLLLSLRIYKDPTIRISHDIDLLIDKKKINSVVDILTSNRFLFSEGMFWPQQEMQQEQFTQTIHHLSFYNKELNICVEIHWILMHEVPANQNKIKLIIERNLTLMNFSGRTFSVLSPEFELLYLLIHGARHGWNRLKWLMDIRDYPFLQIDRHIFRKLADQFQAWRIIGQTNILLDHFFNTQMPFSRKKRISKYLVRHAFNYIKDDKIQHFETSAIFLHFMYLWYLFPSFFYKIKILSRTFFRLGDLREIDSSFRLVYFLYRPYSFIKRRVFHG